MDDTDKKLVAFEGSEIRRIWHNDDWYYSVVDVIQVLTDSKNPRNYWSMLKKRELEHEIELSTNCVQLKLESKDGKKYSTDCANSEGIFRIIQSIPSKKAEPFKRWLAKVGQERVDEYSDPELAISRAIYNYQKLGYSKDWINQRIKTIEARKELTDEWDKSGVSSPNEYAFLTDEMTKIWSGKSVREYKEYKGLKKENLRDNMTNLELALNLVSELTAKEISKKETPSGLDESLNVAKRGAQAGKAAKDVAEKQLGRSVISSKNAKQIHFKDKKKLN